MNRDSFKHAMDMNPAIGPGRLVFALDEPLRQLQATAAKRAMIMLQNAVSELQDRVAGLEAQLAAKQKAAVK